MPARKLPAFLHNRLVQVGLALAAVAIALTLAWRYTDLSEVVTVEAVLGWIEAMRGKEWAPFALALAYTPASIVMFPRPLLTLAAVVGLRAVERVSRSPWAASW
jgi:hypothetical protein